MAVGVMRMIMGAMCMIVIMTVIMTMIVPVIVVVNGFDARRDCHSGRRLRIELLSEQHTVG